jgi:iron complex transport system ATP-binding protein
VKTASKLLEARAVEAGYGAVPVLRSVSVAVEAGEVVALVGPNGEGKSTLVRILAGLMEPWSGEVRLGEMPLAAQGGRERARRLAVLLQGARPAFPFTVEEVVAQARYPWTGSWSRAGDRDREAVRVALARTGAEGLAGRKIGALSGGEWQRVSLARVLAQEAAVLLLDEPAGQLDLRHRAMFRRILREEAREGRGILCVLHDLELARRVADRAVLLAGGQVVDEGPPEVVLRAERLGALYGIRDEGEGG